MKFTTQLSLFRLLRYAVVALALSALTVWAEDSPEDLASDTEAVSAEESVDAVSAEDSVDAVSAEDSVDEVDANESESAASDQDTSTEDDSPDTQAESDTGLVEDGEEEVVDINDLVGPPPSDESIPAEELGDEEALSDGVDEQLSEDSALGDDGVADETSRPSARGIGGKKTDSGPSQAIQTESVDTSQAEAAAEREQQLLEEEAEIKAKQKELERRLRIERGLDEQIQDLKEEALVLGKELRLLSEKLIYPASTQVTVFVSLKELDNDFFLDSIELKMNGRLVGSHLYTLRELDALRKGGVQRIFDGNLRSGEHFLELVVNSRDGNDPNTVNWRYEFSKGANPHFVELKIFEDSISAKSW